MISIIKCTLLVQIRSELTQASEARTSLLHLVIVTESLQLPASFFFSSSSLRCEIGAEFAVPSVEVQTNNNTNKQRKH